MQLDFWKFWGSGASKTTNPSAPAEEPQRRAPTRELAVEPVETDPLTSTKQLNDFARAHCMRLDAHRLAARLVVIWNPRLKSTAGLARLRNSEIELNPLLSAFEGEVQRTLLHELAHLLAFERAGRRRVPAHGHAWRKACADLGIPDEKATHRLPLPRSQRVRRYFYACPQCQTVIARVRLLRGRSACATCCSAHSGGKFDERFLLGRVDRPRTPPPIRP